MVDTLTWLAVAAALWHTLLPSAAALLAMMPTVATVTFKAMPSVQTAAVVAAVSCLAGAALPEPVSVVPGAAQLGAVAYLVAAAARWSGFAPTRTGSIVVAVLAVAVCMGLLLHWRGRGKNNF